MYWPIKILYVHVCEPWHGISNNVILVCATSKASDQPAHTRSLSRAFASRLNILRVFFFFENILFEELTRTNDPSSDQLDTPEC